MKRDFSSKRCGRAEKVDTLPPIISARDSVLPHYRSFPSSLLSFAAANLRLLGFTVLFSIGLLAQTPTVSKVDPPNWWTGMTINPVRVLLRGTELRNATVLAPQGSGLKAANLKWSENGHYLFFDLTIAASAKPGKYKLIVSKRNTSTSFSFDVHPRSSREGKYQGYTPDDVIYLLMPDRFDDGDQSNNDPERSKSLYDRTKTRRYHGGDLQGVIDKLPYLKSLGVTAIWTTPVYDNNDKLDTEEVYDGEQTTGYHGYGAVDMYGVEEHFGDIPKLKEMVDKAHALGLKMIQDQVANHTGPFHVWANDPPTPTWWNGTADHHISNNWQKWTTMNPRATYQTQRRNLEGWFVDILPDFNQNDPEVEKYLIQNSIWWIETAGYDAIRMDTLPHVPRTFWAKWGSAIKHEYPKLNILGELFDGDPALLAYFQTGRKGFDGVDTQIDTLFDFTLYYSIRDAFAQGKPVRAVSQTFAHDWLYPKPEVLTSFLGNHDVSRFMGETGATIEGLKLADTLIMTSRGTPIIYYGDEIAMSGGGDPDNRRDFSGGFPADGIDKFAASGRNSTENEVWNYLAKLGRLRRELEPLRSGKTLDLLDEDQQMAYARVTAKEAVIVVINNDIKPASVGFDFSMIKKFSVNKTFVDRLGNVSPINIHNSWLTFQMPARSAAILVDGTK
ncbi:MAG: alpha-amylase family glycosyl hydrolase [Pyrinomonadaceae bacterium]